MKPHRSSQTLGVVAIAHNEEKDMPGFLAHLLTWIDEIVIVDDNSTDGTAELATSAGSKVKFIRSARQAGEYYSHQRNKGIQAATSDWLLHMDIDERVPPELAEEILSAINNPAKEGYRFRRHNFFLHRPLRGGGWQNWNLIHLARRTKFRFGGKMHEIPLLDAPADMVGQLRTHMWHLNDSDYVERVRKNMVYMQIEAENMIEKECRIRWFHFVVHPLYRAFRAYFWEAGFRDGVLGVLYAMHVLTGTFNWYATAWDRMHAIPREILETELRTRWREAPINR
jgi:(heptosyl)LPS beta-1,4-glucosyltransferase